ncbi:hypothetical protein V6N11_014187 [Hibiscus sabdariffa]|uniref:Uncharacterized protein n=2 Tax=Hibiscus sabdariffa TaxID=183260 RepID=A0ABR2AFV0_9ROSI
MLGVQTYYARAASPAHLLYPLRLHPTSSYPDIKPFYKNSRQQESKKTIAIGLGASRGGGKKYFKDPASWTRKNRRKGMPDPSY